MGTSRKSRPAAFFVLLLGVGSMLLSSCGGSDDSGGATYLAEFAWFQKNAYINTDGSKYYCWPPHTATRLRVLSLVPGNPDPTVVSEAKDCNQGTCPGDTDEKGRQILTQVLTEVASGSLETLTALSNAFETCACSNGFLSADDLSGSSANQVEAAGGDCQTMLETVLQDAVTLVLKLKGEKYEDYHVCNNLAKLEANLWDSYLATGKVVPCDGTSPICAGPLWYYDVNDSRQ